MADHRSRTHSASREVIPFAAFPNDEQDEWKELWDEVAKLRDHTAPLAIKK